MLEQLTHAEARVLGSLVEKQLTTPEYYPLTLNALTAACNQKSNREPVVSYDETTITGAVDTLRDKNLVYLFYGSNSRAVKYKHMLPSVFDLDAAGVAIVAVLLLRGPQTLGELRERTGRLYEFSGMGEVQETLDGLTRRDDPLIVKLERQPGQKEARYAHLLCGEVEQAAPVIRESGSTAVTAKNDRIENLEAQVETLRDEFASLRETFEEFRKQFE
ncbi:MAG TPA: YceH family protein [Pyrinomonadaceae bacterium]|nr:YceH family protein [Pyrinomonadaceae bacterium]